jgi:hypothetical protein
MAPAEKINLCSLKDFQKSAGSILAHTEQPYVPVALSDTVYIVTFLH